MKKFHRILKTRFHVHRILHYERIYNETTHDKPTITNGLLMFEDRLKPLLYNADIVSALY